MRHKYGISTLHYLPFFNFALWKQNMANFWFSEKTILMIMASFLSSHLFSNSSSLSSPSSKIPCLRIFANKSFSFRPLKSACGVQSFIFSQANFCPAYSGFPVSGQRQPFVTFGIVRNQQPGVHNVNTHS